MPNYLFQWKYKDPAIKAMMETPQDRPAELRKAVEAFGGRMHQFFFAFGEFDGVKRELCGVRGHAHRSRRPRDPADDCAAHRERGAGGHAAGKFG